MNRILMIVTVLVAVLIVAGQSFAQQGQIFIDRVSTLIGGDTLKVESPARFLLRYINNTGERCNISNGFEITSPDGAAWDSVTMDTAGLNIEQDGIFTNKFALYFNLVFARAGGMISGGDGSTPDTVGVLGAGSTGTLSKCLPVGFDDTCLAITVWMQDVNTNFGKHLCIDTSFWGVGGTWVWVGVPSLTEFHPVFNGLTGQPFTDNGYCFTFFGMPPGPSDTVYVPDDYTTIQNGVNAVSPGGVILVKPGTYAESIVVSGKAVTIKSTNGPLVTTITNTADKDLVIFDSTATNGSVLDGFTLLGGRIGVWCQNAAPTISHNIVRGQHMTNWAAIVLAGGAYGTSGESPAVVVNNTIVNCTGGGLSSFSPAKPTIKNNIIAFNAKYGIHVDGSDPTDISYNDIFGNPVPIYNGDDPGPGALTLDPKLAPDFTLLAGSPCINAGDPDPKYNDPDHTRNDMGAVYFHGEVPPTGDTLHVPADYVTIQEAINAAEDGQLVLVAPGIYPGAINFSGKHITIRSAEGPLVTEIVPPSAATDAGALVTFNHGEDTTAVFEGFTLRSGWIGIYCENSGPIIRHNVLVDQHVTDWAAIALAGPGYPQATYGHCPAIIVNNTITRCANGGISTFSDSTPTIKNNIIAFNGAYGIHKQTTALPLTISYNDIYGNPQGSYNVEDFGPGAMSADPLLTAALTLSANSPCIDAGDPDGSYNDPDGSRNDMGAVPFGGDIPPMTKDTVWVPTDFATIPAAIEAVNPGGVVLVKPGTYTGNFVIDGKSVELKSTDGPLATVISGNNGQPLVIVRGAAASNCIIEGFKFDGGLLGVWCQSSGPIIRHNLFYHQYATDWAAISLSGLSWGSLGPSPARIINNTITASTGGGISIYSTASPVIKNNIIAFNTKYGIHRDGLGPAAVPDMTYNDLFGNPIPMYNLTPGTGDIALDPLFASNYTLLDGSPCINAGDPDPKYNDPNGSRNDMGAIPFNGQVSQDPIPTNEWIVVYCPRPTLEGRPIAVGTVIRAFDPNGVICGKAAVNPDGSLGFMPIYRDDPYSPIDEGALPGDLISFRVGTDAVGPNPPVVWTKNGDEFLACDFHLQSCQQIQLHAGWNLISWNVKYMGDVKDLIAPVAGCVDLVMSYDQGGLVYDPQLEPYSTLHQVDYFHGYWFKMSCDAVLEVCGKPTGMNDIIACRQGWNLVSYLPNVSMTPLAAFVTISHNLQVALGYENGAKVYRPDNPSYNTLTQLKPGFGYWVRLAAADGLDYFFMPAGENNQPTLTQTTAEPLGSTAWMSLYGDHITLDGAPVPDGSQIDVYAADGSLIGSGNYANNILRFLPVYGADGSDAAAKYARENDQVTLKVNGIAVAERVTWSGHGTSARLTQLTSGSLPTAFALQQNYPNPFNPETKITFDLPHSGKVKLVIFDLLGRNVRTLVDENLPAGSHEVLWNGRDNTGEQTSSGIYFYRLEASGFSATKKMVLVK